MPDITRTLLIRRPPSAVWAWFSSQERLRQWLRPTLEIDLQVGGRYRMLGSESATWISGEVLEVVPNERLVLSWLEEDAGWQHPARLTFSLRPVTEGTEVSLIHDGFDGIGLVRWRDIADNYTAKGDDHRVLEGLAELVEAV